MKCKYLIGICAKTHLPCPHCAVDGECDEAACTNAVVPTWNQLIDIYTAAKRPQHKTLNKIVCGLKRITEALGVDMDDKVLVTDEQLDHVYAELLKRYAPDTIADTFNSLKATTSRRREIKMEYRKRGLNAPDIDTPEVKTTVKEKPQLTEGQRLAIRDEMTLRRNSKKASDHKKFIWTWFAWYFGVRPIDICRLQWSCLFEVKGKHKIKYIPSKTTKKCKGRPAGGVVPEKWWEEIKPFVGKPDEYVIPRLENRRPKSGCAKVKHGEYVAHHLTLRQYEVSFMRGIGVNVRLPAYALRKDCAQRMISELGPLHESIMLGHKPQMAADHYAELTDLDLKEGL